MVSYLSDMSSTPDSPSPAPDSTLDKELRPSSWDDYVGQRQTKENLKVLLDAARERNHAPEHLLFYGPPGLGKTTLAHLIAKTIGATLRPTSGPAIEKVGDLASILTNLAPGDVLFIDEIHRLSSAVEEVLYPAMESGVLDIVIGKGPSARSIQLDLPPFTLVAATTRVAEISSPLRSRFSGGVHRLEFYSPEEIAQIVARSAGILGVDLDRASSSAIAARARQTPRTANYLLKRCRDVAQLRRCPLSPEVIDDALAMLEIDAIGLNKGDRAVLEAIADKYSGGPVGLGTLAAALGEEQSTIEEFHEPYLMQLGLLERTPRGRVLTAAAYKHLGKAPPPNLTEKLL
jgi:Holliday junction DNA helicase RuvB